MKNLVKLIAPAKVNLVLAVGGVREDGFHEVDTVMHALALHDSLTMRRFDEDEGGLKVLLGCETSGDIAPLEVPAEENIVYRAVVELASELGRAEDESIQIQLAKSIPAESGLGGGSSDAAAALVGAAELWGIDPLDPRVQAVAARLGADVAFFLRGGCARLSGKGEVFEAQLAPRKGFVLLLRPEEGVSTGKAYAAFDADPMPIPAGYRERIAAVQDAAEIEPWNNMENAACAVTPAVAEVLEWARALPDAQTVLCGSGSAVCAILPSYEAASAASLEAHKRGLWARVTSFAPLGAAVLQSF